MHALKAALGPFHSLFALSFLRIFNCFPLLTASVMWLYRSSILLFSFTSSFEYGFHRLNLFFLTALGVGSVLSLFFSQFFILFFLLLFPIDFSCFPWRQFSFVRALHSFLVILLLFSFLLREGSTLGAKVRNTLQWLAGVIGVRMIKAMLPGQVVLDEHGAAAASLPQHRSLQATTYERWEEVETNKHGK